MRRLEFPKNMAEEISWLVYHHDVPIPEERKKLKALIRELGFEDLKNLLLCEIADSRAKKVDSEPEQTIKLRESLAALNEIIETGECYDISQLAITKQELIERRLVKSDAEAQDLLNALFDVVLDKPSFNNRLMLLDMVESSKQKLEQIEEARRRAQIEKEQREKEQKAKGRRSEPIFRKNKS